MESNIPPPDGDIIVVDVHENMCDIFTENSYVDARIRRYEYS
jgi:hypothetical protein